MLHRTSRRAEPAPEDSRIVPVRVVRVALPGGRSAVLRVPGGLVPAQAVERLAAEVTRQQERRARRLRRLGVRARVGHAQLARAQRRGLQRGLERMLAGDERLSERARQFQADWEKDASAQLQLLRKRLARSERRALLQPALLISALPLYALYGRHNLQHNLTLLILLLVWLYGEELTDLLSSQKDAADADSRSLGWQVIAPAANVLAGWWLLHEQQHEPFVTGMTGELERLPTHASLPQLAPAAAASSTSALTKRRYHEQYVTVVDLVPFVATGFELDLLGLEDPPVLVTPSSLRWSPAVLRRSPRVDSVTAFVEAGKLHVCLRASAWRAKHDVALIESVRVSWVVRVLDEATLSRCP